MLNTLLLLLSGVRSLSWPPRPANCTKRLKTTTRRTRSISPMRRGECFVLVSLGKLHRSNMKYCVLLQIKMAKEKVTSTPFVACCWFVAQNPTAVSQNYRELECKWKVILNKSKCCSPTHLLSSEQKAWLWRSRIYRASLLTTTWYERQNDFGDTYKH